MQITKAVITAAGRGARQYPASDTVQKAMLPLVDRDGLTKPVLQIIAEEAIDSGIEEICVVGAPGDEAYYRHQFRSYAEQPPLGLSRGSPGPRSRPGGSMELEARLHFAVQPEPEGYGHAVWCAPGVRRRRAVPAAAGGPPLHLPDEHRRCARQLLDLAADQDCAVSAVQATREHLIHQYGTLTGKRLQDRPDVYVIDEIIEKPTLTLAELRLQVPGFGPAITSASSACTC